VERDDIALLALTGSQEPYAALKLSELDRSERRERTAAELSESLRQYLYAKYVYRAIPETQLPREPTLRLAVGADSQELAEG
jgi:hypothetical protein